MTTRTHTPGPWHVDDEGETGEYSDIWIGTEGGGHSIARLGDDPQPSHEQRLADARLIAAAPDLLVALVGLLSHVESWQIIETANGDIARARRAIAKVVGS